MLCVNQTGDTILNLSETTLVRVSIVFFPVSERWGIDAECIGDSDRARLLGVYSTEKQANEVFNALTDNISENLPFYVMPHDREEGDDDAADKSE